MLFNSKTHGVIDYLFVGFLLVAPSIMDLPYHTSTLTYLLALGYLVIAACTNYEYGLIRKIPFKVHGTIEIIMAIMFVAVGFYLGHKEDLRSQYLYLALAGVTMAVWILTDWQHVPTGLEQGKSQHAHSQSRPHSGI
jgi:hypothetical protein